MDMPAMRLKVINTDKKIKTVSLRLPGPLLMKKNIKRNAVKGIESMK